MKNEYLISAIISLFKGEKFIKGRLEDLLSQTLGNKVEIIIIDSNSPENEKAIIDHFLPDNPNIKYVRTAETESMYSAWNRGIQMANGKYITNANADDRLAEFALEQLCGELEKDESLGLVYGDYYISPEENEKFETAKNKNSRVVISKEFSRINLLNGYMCGPQSVWRREIHTKHDIWFDGTFEITGDYKFVCEVSEKYKIRRIPGVFGVYFRSKSDENKEFQNVERTLAEAFRIKYEYAKYLISQDVIKSETRFSSLLKVVPSKSVFLTALVWRLFRVEDIAYETIYLFEAIFQEVKGNLSSCNKIIKKFRKYKNARLIYYYSEHLKRQGLLE